jgi:hypothetical protein
MPNRIQRLIRIGAMGGAAPAKIYGVSWSGAQSPALTRTDSSVNMVAAAGVGTGVVVNNFDSAEIYRDITDVTDAYGNVFVRIPKFYIEKTAVGAARTWRISKQPFGNAYLPACFANASYVDVGKYNAFKNGTKLESKAGLAPYVSDTIVNFRTFAQNNGAGYYQMDIHVHDILRTLFYVEFATLNSQSIMAGFTAGQFSATHVASVAENAVNRIVLLNAFANLYAVGQTISIGSTVGGNQIFYGRTITSIDVYDATQKAISFDGGTVNIAVGNILYNTGWISGFSTSIVAKSGSPVSNSSGLYPCMYRGVENPWGSVWEFIDGLNIAADYQSWVCRTPANYASNLFAAPYVQLSYANANADGYSTVMGLDLNNPFAELPTTLGGASNTYYADYYYRSTGNRIAFLGGHWRSGPSAGLSGWNLNYASSTAAVDLGGRLIRAGA